MSKMRARYNELVDQRTNLQTRRDKLAVAKSNALITGEAFIGGDQIKILDDNIRVTGKAIAHAAIDALLAEARGEDTAK